MAQPSSYKGSNSHSDRDNRTISPSSETSAPVLGAEAEALILCNQKLQELGIDSTIKLPQICVVGNQSTGKSSLIEAISTVKVPKARGLCTQCPIAINLSAGPQPDSAWTCAVYIEKRYDYNDSYPRRTKGKNSLGPWQERSTIELTHVKTTQDKDEVTELIRAAQLTILNPGSRYQDHLVQNDNDEQAPPTTMFSPNAIRLDISEASWPNLSFVDLPGVIANTRANEKDRHLVGMIKKLVEKYASANRSVNMLTLPMDHDIANSTACAIIQELKVEDRTLAVFTKADKVDKDLRTSFLNSFLGGGEDDLGFHHGYHFVIMPEEADLDEAREIESAMFAQEPWVDLDSRYKSRLGVPALTTHLRKLLFEKTRETLPTNLKSIEDRLIYVDRQLQSLPEPPNPVLLPLQLQQTVTRFENAMKMLFSGELTGESVSAIMEWSQVVEKFGSQIARAKPTMYLESRTELNRLRKAETTIRAIRSRNEHASGAVMVGSSDEDVSRPTVKTETPGEPKFDPTHRFRFEEIRDINKRYYQACVPGEIELRAIQEMHRLSVRHWDKLLAKFMNECGELINKQVEGVLHEIFDGYKHLEVYQIVKDHVKGYLDGAFQHEWDATKELCQIERETPMTCQLDSLKEKESKCLNERLLKRAARRVEIATAELNAYEGVVKKRREPDLDIPQPDPYATELLMAAKTRAYYEVAGARFTDNVNSRILGCLLPACNGKLVESLKQFLGLNDPTRHDQIVRWMTEDPAREQKRQHLLHEKKQLTEGLCYIQDVLGTNDKILKRPSSPTSHTAVQSTSPAKRAKVAQASRSHAASLMSTPTKLSKGIDHMDLDEED